MLAKCVLAVTRAESKESCGTKQLCGVLEAEIEGGIPVVRLMWQQYAQEEDWGFLLIDACNAFNEENRTVILWEVRHECPSGARFVFNCYRHWATQVIRAGNGTLRLLYIKEGVNQGDPLVMVAYRLGILPLICEFRTSHPSVTQPWCAYEAGAGGTFEEIRRHLDDLIVQGSLCRYFREPTKSILVVSTSNVPRAESFFRGYRLQIVTGSCYLGGFPGRRQSRNSGWGRILRDGGTR